MAINRYIAIATERLQLRPTNPDYTTLGHIVGWLNDPVNVRYSEQRHRAHTKSSEEAYIDSFRLPSRFWTIYHHNSDPIGTITASVDVNNSVADMGILIGRKYWGHGYGLEAWKMVMDCMFDEGIKKIEAGCMASNKGMLAIFEYAGMKQEGTRPGHFLLAGKREDLIHVGRLNDNG